MTVMVPSFHLVSNCATGLRQGGQALDGGVDALVGGGERDPDVLAAGRAIELARGNQDAQAGQQFDRPPAVVAGPPR